MAAYDTTPLIRILDDNINTGPHTPFSPERGHVVRPSTENPENQLATGSGIMDGYSIIQGAVVTILLTDKQTKKALRDCRHSPKLFIVLYGIPNPDQSGMDPRSIPKMSLLTYCENFIKIRSGVFE